MTLFYLLYANTENRLYFLPNSFFSLDIGIKNLFVNDAGLVKLYESSKYYEKLRATLDLILHISTGLWGFTPSDHLSNYSNKFPIVQFHAFGWLWCKNFYKFDLYVFPDITLLTLSLSFRYYFIASDTESLEFKAGNLYTKVFGC